MGYCLVKGRRQHERSSKIEKARVRVMKDVHRGKDLIHSFASEEKANTSTDQKVRIYCIERIP